MNYFICAVDFILYYNIMTMCQLPNLTFLSDGIIDLKHRKIRRCVFYLFWHFFFNDYPASVGAFPREDILSFCSVCY